MIMYALTALFDWLIVLTLLQCITRHTLSYLIARGRPPPELRSLVETECALHSSVVDAMVSYGSISIVNKDGSFGKPIEIKKSMTFGSSNPANIRIKSKNICAEHARVDIDLKAGNCECYLTPLTDKHEPKLNDSKVKIRKRLANNDRISLGGRVFIFNTISSYYYSTSPGSLSNQSEVSSSAAVIIPPNREVFGELSLSTVDGVLDAVVKIRGDLIIGREFPSTFRIKSPYISKQHIKIAVNENKECVLSHLSRTNPPKINNVVVNDIILKHLDVISVGKFKFTFTSTVMASGIHSGKTVTKGGGLCTGRQGIFNRNSQNSDTNNMMVKISKPSKNFKEMKSLDQIETINDNQGNVVQTAFEESYAPPSICLHENYENLCVREELTSPDIEVIEVSKHPQDNQENELHVLPTPMKQKSSNTSDEIFSPSDQSMKAMMSDTKALLPSGRPSLDTMTAQWEFMRDQFLGSSDEALEWLMLSKSGGLEAYKHASRKANLAEDQYFKSLYDIDLLTTKKKFITQGLSQLLCGTNNDRNFDQELSRLKARYSESLSEVCSQQLRCPIEQLLLCPSDAACFAAVRTAFNQEIRILTERLQMATTASEESLGEMEKWSGRAKHTTAYDEVVLAEDVLWMQTQQSQNEFALAQMRSLIPPNISKLSMSEFSNTLRDNGGFYSHALCSEIKKNKLLHLVVMHSEDIAKLNFLVGESRQYFMDLNLDIVEMRAIRACLPDVFELDKDGRKAEWKEQFMYKLKSLVSREGEEMVKGGWDAEAGRRVMVRQPSLQATERRRSLYHYESHEQLLKRLERFDKQNAQLNAKKMLLKEEEKQHQDLKAEYDTILCESRNPHYQKQYGVETLSLAKHRAKDDCEHSSKRIKMLLSDISRLEASIRTASYTKEDIIKYIADHSHFLPHWKHSLEPIEIKGVFDCNPDIRKAEKASAVFATAEEEAANRKLELVSLKRTSSTGSIDDNNRCMKSASSSSLSRSRSTVGKLNVNDATAHTLKNMFQKQSFEVNHQQAIAEGIATKQPTKSKNLQKILTATAGGLTSENLSPPVKRPLSFLDQLKNIKKKN